MSGCMKVGRSRNLVGPNCACSALDHHKRY